MNDEELVRLVADRARRLGQKVSPVAISDVLEASEAALGFALPPTLRLLFSRVGNGGFGPLDTIAGVIGGSGNNYDETLVEEYLGWRKFDPQDPNRAWPERVLPVQEWGCGEILCVDCREPGERLVLYSRWAAITDEDEERFDPKLCYRPIGQTLREYLVEWTSEA